MCGQHSTSETSQSLRVLYHRLGTMIDRLEDAERGEFPDGQKILNELGAEPLLVGERQACLKARLLMLQRAWLASAQAVVDAKPQLGDEVVMVELRRVCVLEGRGGFVDEATARLN